MLYHHGRDLRQTPTSRPLGMETLIWPHEHEPFIVSEQLLRWKVLRDRPLQRPRPDESFSTGSGTADTGFVDLGREIDSSLTATDCQVDMRTNRLSAYLLHWALN